MILFLFFTCKIEKLWLQFCAYAQNGWIVRVRGWIVWLLSHTAIKPLFEKEVGGRWWVVFGLILSYEGREAVWTKNSHRMGSASDFILSGQSREGDISQLGTPCASDWNSGWPGVRVNTWSLLAARSSPEFFLPAVSSAGASLKAASWALRTMGQALPQSVSSWYLSSLPSHFFPILVQTLSIPINTPSLLYLLHPPHIHASPSPPPALTRRDPGGSHVGVKGQVHSI